MHMTDFRGHSSEWESRCVADLLMDMGYDLDVVNWKPVTPIAKSYDVTFDIVSFQGLQPGGVKLLHLTEADPGYTYQAELERVSGRGFEIRRSMPDRDITYQAIEKADRKSVV